MRGGESLDCVQELHADARSSSLRADGHAPNVEVGALGHRGDGADDHVRELGNPDWTLRKALRDLIRGRGRRAERSRRVECFELGKSCSQRSRDRLRIVFLGKPNGHARVLPEFGTVRVPPPDEKELSYRWRERAFVRSTICFINSSW